MKLDELRTMLAQGATAAALAEAVGQRMVRVPHTWVWEAEGAVCECGLLLVELPQPVELERSVLVPGADGVRRPRRVRHVLYHAHAADAAGRPVCMECVGEEIPCAGHPAELCDTPNAWPCGECVDQAALPGQDHCRECAPQEAEWDKDRYLGL